jgi:PII-like signaling protein
MREERNGKLLRIYVDEADRYEERPLYEAIVAELRSHGFTGATVLKGIEGYGSHKAVHAARVFDIASTLPVVIEVIEEDMRIDAVLDRLKEMIRSGLLTLETVRLTHLSRTGESV